MDTAFEKRVIAKVAWRLIPFLVLSYMLNFVDRVNLGFAALTMNKEFGFSATVFGWGAGILFFGYFFFGIPCNLALSRWGARRCLSSILVLWGIVSACMIFIRGEYSFYAMRFLLGAAEAGFFPGVILYLTLWFPASYRATFVSRFMFAQPIALMVGSAVSGWLLGLDGAWGIAGWKWLFVLEGIPAAVVGLIAFGYLTNRPKDATWLAPEERTWLQDTLDREAAMVSAKQKISAWKALSNPRLLLLCVIYTAMVIGVYGVNMWLPQIVRSFGETDPRTIGILAAIPFLAASIGMLIVGKSSDFFKERKLHVTATMLMAGLALLASTQTTGSIPVTILLLSISSIGMYACMPIFWTIPPTFLTGAAVAAGIGLINSIGNLGGFAGPFLIGWIKDETGSFMSGLIFLGVCVVLGSILTYFVCRRAEADSARAAAPLAAVGSAR